MEKLKQIQKELGGEIKFNKLYIEDLIISEILELIFIDNIPGCFYTNVAIKIIKGCMYDKLQYKFEMLEREYYKLQEEYDKSQLENIELSGE